MRPRPGLFALLFTASLLACGDDQSSTASDGASSDGSSAGEGDDFFFCQDGDLNSCTTGQLCVQHLSCDAVSSFTCEAPPQCDGLGEVECWGQTFCDAATEQVEVIKGFGTTVNCRPLMCAGTDSETGGATDTDTDTDG